MNASLNWINAYLDRPIDAEEAEQVLTNVGFPLDGVDPVEGDPTDTLLDVEVTSNRSDVLSHVGIAREIAAATGRALQPPAIELPAATGDTVDTLTSVANDATDLCPAYTARVITGVSIGESPDWLKARLTAVGSRPVNNVVDITNFVLLELGQPLHAFDMGKLDERRIVVRRATAGEPFTAIDGTKHKLTADMLVIADASTPQAVAGVMGGHDSEVTEQTTDILLESATFDPLSVRSTSRALKLSSDSSYRFERGVDPAGIERASQRAAQLIIEIAGGTLAGGVITAGSVDTEPRQVGMRPSRCDALLGVDLPAERMMELLGSLGLEPHAGGGKINCTIPTHRLDLHREVDLIEEVARLHGFDAIPVEDKITIVARRPQPRVEARKLVSRTLVAHGFCETVTFSNLATDAAQAFAGDRQVVALDEEKAKAAPALRPSVLPSLLVCRKSNQDAGNANVRLFEIAQTFGSRDGDYAEARKLALLADAADPAEALRSIRGLIEELAASLGLDVTITEPDSPVVWAEAAATVVSTNGGTPLGAYGIASSATLDRFDLQSPVVLAELDYEALIRNHPRQPVVATLPRYPAIERDLSIVVDESTAWSTIAEHIRAAEPALLEDTAFVGVYRGKQMSAGRKSVTLRMTFRDPERTLKHEEVTEQVDAVVARLKDQVNAELRAG